MTKSHLVWLSAVETTVNSSSRPEQQDDYMADHYERFMRYIGMRDSKDTSVRQRLQRMSTWQSSTSTLRLAGGLLFRAIALITLGMAVWMSDNSLARIASAIAILVFVPSTGRIVGLLVARIG